jgi:hypothetical protein
MIKKKKLLKMGNYGSIDNYKFSNEFNNENDFYNYKPTFINHIKDWWKSFWWKYVSPNHPICYGGVAEGYYKFRWQRLQNIVIMLMLVAIFFVLKIML